MATEKTLEQVLREYFVPTEKKAKGEPQFLIVVNGKTISTPVKTQADLDRTLRSMAIEDARTGRKTKVVVYELKGEADVSFESTITVGTPAAAEVAEVVETEEV